MATQREYASNFVEGVDNSFIIILGIIIFFLIAISVTMIYFIWRYRKSKNPIATQIKGNIYLEICWTLIPTILVMVMFYFGWTAYKPMRDIPKENFEIDCIARMWNWQFKYKNDRRTDTLFVPKNRSIKLNLIAKDVIHSIYIPAFRVKQDIVPSQKSAMWFVPGKEGLYDLFCTEYCGLNHSSMITTVKVMDEEKFELWYKDTIKQVKLLSESPSKMGYRIAKMNACFSCHSIDGTRGVGPSWKNLYGKTEIVKTKKQKREIIVDDEYIIKSIYEPDYDIVDSFSRGLMLSYRNEIPEDDVEKIIEFIKSISKNDKKN